MPHPVFTAHVKHMDALRAQRILDAAEAAAVQFHPLTWWDSMLARARGVVAEIKDRIGPLFTFNSRPINTSRDLRSAFSEHVSSGVES